MFDYFAEQLKSDVADVKNTGGRPGGAITAAKFLEKFVDKKPWVHLDIAGPAFASSSKPHREGGGTRLHGPHAGRGRRRFSQISFAAP